MVTLSWIILILQLLALYFVVRNVPIFVVRMVQISKLPINTDMLAITKHPHYYVLVFAVMVLVFFGLPSFS